MAPRFVGNARPSVTSAVRRRLLPCYAAKTAIARKFRSCCAPRVFVHDGLVVTVSFSTSSFFLLKPVSNGACWPTCPHGHCKAQAAHPPRAGAWTQHLTTSFFFITFSSNVTRLPQSPLFRWRSRTRVATDHAHSCTCCARSATGEAHERQCVCACG